MPNPCPWCGIRGTCPACREAAGRCRVCEHLGRPCAKHQPITALPAPPAVEPPPEPVAPPHEAPTGLSGDSGPPDAPLNALDDLPVTLEQNDAGASRFRCPLCSFVTDWNATIGGALARLGAHTARRHEAAPCDPVGATEIAERLGVKPGTVWQWQQRGLLPPARWQISGRPAWQWADVAEWAGATGRLPDERRSTR